MKSFNRFGKIVLFFLLCTVAFFGKSVTEAKAGIVEPTGKGTDAQAIQNELNESGRVTLVDGETYYLHRTLILGSNMEIDATGATIVCDRAIALNIPEKSNYQAANHIYFKGGTWKFENEEGYYGTAFKFTHARDLKFENMKIRMTNFKGHSIELVACKDILIENCDISGIGESLDFPDHFREEAVQLDIADERTAPYLRTAPFYTEMADELYNGAGCQNVTIKKCKIIGNRGVSTNYSPNGMKNTYHKNINILNNKITGLKSEALVLFNTASANVKGNRIETKRKGSADAYTVGLHFANFSTRKELAKGKFVISKNTIYGGRQALIMHSHSGVKFGPTKIENNKLFCKAGEKAALYAREVSVQKLSIKNNTLKAYKEKK